MTIVSLSFLLGNVGYLYLAWLPQRWMVVALGLLVGCWFIITERASWKLGVLGLLLGFSYVGMRVDSRELPLEKEEVPIQVRGIVASMPTFDKLGAHFRMDGMRLTWVGKTNLKAGDEYQLTVKLKRIHGVKNPGSFNYETWAKQNRINAQGTVVRKMPQIFIKHHYFKAPIEQIRQHYYELLQPLLPPSATSPWLMALMLGERHQVQPSHWQILRATGTNHLMAIAGLHIGLVSGFIYVFVSFLWRRSKLLCEKIPAQLAAASSSLVVAWIYSALSGFALPTQRAAIMVTFILIAVLLRRKLLTWHAWSAAMLVILLLDPLAVLSESFWLSFGTIALIIYGMQGRLQANGWWHHYAAPQWVIGLGLIPFSLLFFQEASLISFVANCIAIPWLGFLILPFCLLSLILVNFSNAAAYSTLWVADKSLAALWMILTALAKFDFAVYRAALLSPWIFIATSIACLLLLLPRSTPGKYLGIFWLLPLLFQQAITPNRNEFWVNVLDVGQGLSVVVQTKQHVLVYDAGPRYGDNFDMGEMVVLPFLYASGIRRIDTLVVSHGDNDHIGGAYALLRHLPVSTVLTSAEQQLKGNNVHACVAGTSWQWDGVRFTMLYPDADSLALGNDSSCVLKVENGRHRVLLTGDIEKYAEKKLLHDFSARLPADLMIAPHHGSKTSSQPEMIAAVAPLYVVYATGYRNRYHFPHESVVKRYQEAGVMALNTMATGAIQFKFTQQPLWRPTVSRYYLP